MRYQSNTQYKSLDHIKHYLLDMDGTIYLGNNIFDGTIPFLNKIRSTGRRHLFLTNNSSKSTTEYLHKLAGMSIDAVPDDIFTSGEATIIYLRTLESGNRICLLGTPGLEEQFSKAGFELVNQNPDFVVLGFDKTLTYEKLERACLHIMHGVPFVATHPDFVCPTEDLPIPDCGAMIALITAATGATPKVIGKPNAEMINSALLKLNAKPKNTAIVGDRYYTDMEMGFRSGLTTILVLSGETKKDDLEKMERRPDFIFDSIKDVIHLIS